MAMIFVNLPVVDVERSKRFYGGLGFELDPEFSDDRTACMAFDESIFVMLLAEERFREFINGEIADPTTTEVLNCLTAGSRAEVDELIATALAAGGGEWKPKIDQGPMYGGSFRDPDGHVWELMHMDET